MSKTVLELDLVGYSTIAATLEAGLDVQVSPQLNQQIQGFVNVGLKAAGVSRPDTVMATTGDGAILVFDKPSLAHTFAEAVHEETRRHNSSRPVGIGKRVFRIGVATGDVVIQPKPTGGGYDIAGFTIARAVRLESKANPGEVLCDPDTFAGMTPTQQKCYTSPETVAGKREETFEARRCVLNPDGVTDAEFLTGPPAGVAFEMVPVTRSAVATTPREVRREILSLFRQLKPHQFDDLIFLLNVPIHERPPDVLIFERRKTGLLTWAEGPPPQLDDLLFELREMVRESATNPW